MPTSEIRSEYNVACMKLRGRNIPQGERLATPDEKAQIMKWIQSSTSGSVDKGTSILDSEIIVELRKGGTTSIKPSSEKDFVEVCTSKVPQINFETVYYRSTSPDLYAFLVSLSK